MSAAPGNLAPNLWAADKPFRLPLGLGDCSPAPNRRGETEFEIKGVRETECSSFTIRNR